MKIGIGIALGAFKFLTVLGALGITWANDLLGSTDTGQYVQSLNPANGVVAVPSAALAFGALPSLTGVLRFEGAASVVKRRKADGLSDLSVLSLGASDAITLGDASTGVFTVQGSKVSMTIASTERAFVDASGLTLPGLTTGRLVMTTTGGLVTDSGNALTIGQVPRATGTGTVAFGALDPAVAAAFATSGEARGDILYRAASNWARLAKGTTGQALIMGASDPAWGTDFGANNLVTTGALLVGTSPAAAGLIRAPTNSEILYAKAFGGTDLAILATTASDNLRIGGSSGGNLVVAGQYFHASSGNFNYHTNNTLYFTLGATTAFYAAGAGACKFGQATVATNGATGSALTIQAQIASGTTSTGGDLNLASGTGTSANGAINLANVATTASAPSAGGGGALPATPLGYVSLKINGTSRQIAYY